MPAAYHAFLDESGQREYDPRTDRYFVVAGAVTRVAELENLRTELDGLKRAFFGTPVVEIKSNWIRNPSERRQRYLNRFKINESRLNTFIKAVYDWILATDIVFIAGVVDKKQMKERYRYPHNPSQVGYHIFLQRYQKFLATRHAAGAVTFDEITGATAAKNQWKDLLVTHHRTLKTRGCRYTHTTFDNVEADIGFANSKTENLLQIADLAAYNTFRQFRSYGSAWDDPSADSLELYEYFALLLPRFHRHSDGVFDGYGVSKMPRKAYHRWLIPGRV